ncbi:hypothetical protein [Actinomycetospora corticicola]
MQTAAFFLGRWFSVAGPSGTVLAIFGVQP